MSAYSSSHGPRPGAVAVAALRAVLCAVLTMTLATSAPALAQGGDDREAAKRHFRAGEQAYDAGQYLIAARAFEESYKLLPIPEIAFSTAQAYRLQYFVDKDRRWLERAIELYRDYIAKQPKGGRRDVAITHLAELEPILMRMAPPDESARNEERPRTEVMISSPVPGAKGVFQGEESELPMILPIDPGRYEVQVSAPGYAPTRRTFQAHEGHFITVEVPLQPLPAQVAIATASGAAITVDGRPQGETPLLQPLALDHGSHFIAVNKRGHRPWSRQVDVSRGQVLELDAPLRTTTQRKVSYAFAATAGLAVLAGFGSSLVAARANRDALVLRTKHEEESLTVPELDRYNQLRDERNTQLGAAIIFFGFASFTATVGGLLWYFDNPRAEAPPASRGRPAEPASGDTLRELSIAPAVGPDRAGLSVSGRFW